MEVLFVSHKYPPAIGGMEKHSYELISGMEQLTTVHKIVCEGNRLRFFLTLKREILRKLKTNPGIRVIHFNDGLMAAFCSFHSGYAHIARTATLHGLDVVFPLAVYRKYILKRFNRYQALIAVSEETRRQAVTRGILPEKITVIPNGADTGLHSTDEELKPSTRQVRASGVWGSYSTDQQLKQDLPGKKILVLLGRPVKRKGFSWFVENVLPLLRPEFHLLIAGPFHRLPTLAERILQSLPGFIRKPVMLFSGYPSDETRLRKLLHHHPRATHLGKLPAPELRRLLKSADAFLMPNIREEGDMEGFGLVCLEASGAGALVIAADIDGIPSAIQDQKNGILLPSGETEIWAGQLNRLIPEADSYRRQAAAFSAYTRKNYSWEIMVNAYYRLFRAI